MTKRDERITIEQIVPRAVKWPVGWDGVSALPKPIADIPLDEFKQQYARTRCAAWSDDEDYAYCGHCDWCVDAREGQSDRQKGDDDGVEYADPRDYRDGRE
jgi:hypothetical protein